MSDLKINIIEIIHTHTQLLFHGRSSVFNCASIAFLSWFFCNEFVKLVHRFISESVLLFVNTITESVTSACFEG